ncbi:hypothetical protein F0562_028454 [Nyssa sinensis]|uniref:DUF1279 domain-containing protein n=1 Tax=Nyssa sinensis TaxID=561372 RepID=A0A5J5B184_9ASTE|nr:hypothetical protein F0562_028454 [Nyssa sinensis]
MAFSGGRFKELFKKYGKVALGVHFSVSAASITGIYLAIKNNVDVESLFEKVGMRAVSTTKEEETQKLPQTNSEMTDGYILEETAHDQGGMVVNKKNRTAELVASSGGALALAILLNKALFPVRVPITVALTPPVARVVNWEEIFIGVISDQQVLKDDCMCRSSWPPEQSTLHTELHRGR